MTWLPLTRLFVTIMAFKNFQSGVKRYIEGVAVVTAYFPVDFRDNSYINCEMCEFYSRSGRRCNLTKRVCEFPEKYVASHCPLQFDDGLDNNENESEENN